MYWSRLLHCLLELQSVDDECLTRCYTEIDDREKAASLFDNIVYGEAVLRFNPNACRRYLQCVYPRASIDERRRLERLYQKQFIVEYDFSFDQMTYEVLPIE